MMVGFRDEDRLQKRTRDLHGLAGLSMAQSGHRGPELSQSSFRPSSFVGVEVWSFVLQGK